MTRKHISDIYNLAKTQGAKRQAWMGRKNKFAYNTAISRQDAPLILATDIFKDFK